MLTIPGTFNFRDLGGVAIDGGTIRPGRLMRSAALDGLGAEGRAAMKRLGVRTALDLREPVERELDPHDLDGCGVLVREQPLLDGRIDVHTEVGLPVLYDEILRSCGDELANAASLLAGPEALPAVVFCSAGKDRTGLVVGIVLSALGASDEDIVADYTATERALDGELMRRLVDRARAAGMSEQVLAVKLGAPAGLMRDVLATLGSRYGGAASYLAAHGFAVDRLAALREALLTDRRG